MKQPPPPIQAVSAFIAAAAFLVYLFVLPRYPLTDTAMYPVYTNHLVTKTNDYGLVVPDTYRCTMLRVNRTAYWFSRPRQGDIIAFADHSQHRVPVRILRIAACPGDTVAVSNGFILVNGTVRNDTPFSNRRCSAFIHTKNKRLPDSVAVIESRVSHHYNARIVNNGPWSAIEYDGAEMPPYTLSDREYFLIGDNYRYAVDSRAFGAVPASAVVGKVIAASPPR